MRVRIECSVCAVAFDRIVDSGIGDTESELLRSLERDGDDVCDDCAPLACPRCDREIEDDETPCQPGGGVCVDCCEADAECPCRGDA